MKAFRRRIFTLVNIMNGGNILFIAAIRSRQQLVVTARFEALVHRWKCPVRQEQVVHLLAD